GRQLVAHVPRGDPAADDARGRDRLDLHLRADHGRLRDGEHDRRREHHFGRDDRQVAGRRPRLPERRCGGRPARDRADVRRLGDHPVRQPAGGAVTAAAPAMERTQDVVVRRKVKQRRDWAKWGLGGYFVLFLIFLYIPIILMAILSFQGSYGQLTFPFRGPVSLDWWKTLFDSNVPNTVSDDVSASGRQSLWLSLVAGGIVAVLGFSLSMAFRRRWRFKSDVVAFYVIMLALMTPAFLVGLGNQLLWKFMGKTPNLWETALGANVVWGIPFS